MALLPILEFPDPRLRTRAATVDAAQVATPEFQKLLDDMFETIVYFFSVVINLAGSRTVGSIIPVCRPTA